MVSYSTADDIAGLRSKSGLKPMFVCDMDGNIMNGYVLSAGAEIDTERLEDTANQTIPFDYDAAELDYYVEQGRVRREIFAAKSMDVRLPPEFVKAINHFIAKDEPFRITLLTSRKFEEALQILKASGVKHPEKVTLVADSGAILQINGEKRNVRLLSGEEQEIKSSIIEKANADDFNKRLQDIVSRHSNVEVKPYVEVKNIAVNVHYRGILDAAEMGEESALAKDLSHFIHTEFAPLVEGTAFETRTGSLTVETIISDINKGHGLKAIVQAATDEGHEPTAVIFSGDDICNYKDERGYGPGTDYYAAIESQRLEEEFGIPFFNTHTHHPEETALTGKLHPKPDSNPAHLPADFPEPEIHLRVPYPWDNATFILGSLGFGAEMKPSPVTMPGRAAVPRRDCV